MKTCAVCGRPFRPEDLVTSRLGETFHSRCIERWQDDDDDEDDTLTTRLAD